MRVSVLRSDPGYCPNAQGSDILVFLDGERVQNVLTFDTDAGEVLVLALDGSGSPLDNDPGAPDVKWLFGSVQAFAPSGWEPARLS